MPSNIISFASHSSPFIFIYHSSHIILLLSSFHSIILAFFTFPLIHFTMVLFAISPKLIFTYIIHHTLLFIIPSSFPSISPPSPSSPLFPAFLSHSHLCSLYIHFHLILPLSHFYHTHSYPFPFQFIIFIQLLSLFWLFILKCSVVYSPFSIHRSLSSHPFLFSFLYLSSYTSHSSRFFALHHLLSSLRSIPCSFGYSFSHCHLVCW